MLSRRIPALAVLVLSLGSTVAMAQANSQFNQTVAQNQDQGGRGGLRGRAQFMQELGLNQQQMEQMQAIQQKYKSKTSQQRQAVRQAQDELRNMMAGTASADEIRKKHDEVRALRQQIEDAQFASLLEMREVMTPEQRAKFAQLMQSRRAKALNHMMNK